MSLLIGRAAGISFGQNRGLKDQILAGLPSWVRDKYTLAFNAAAAEQDIEQGIVYFRDRYMNRYAASFSRSSSATRVNSQGIMGTVGNDMLRIDHTNNEPVALFEPARTNVVLNSSSAPTTLTSVTISEDGTLKGQPVYRLDFPDASVYAEYVNYAMQLSSGSFTNSLYMKASENTDVLLGYSISNTRAAVINLSMEWTRFEDSQTGDNDVNLRIVRRDTYTSTGPVSIWVSMPQVEQGVYATSYIPTSGSSVTRVLESMYIGDLNSSGITAADYTLLFDMEQPNSESNADDAVILKDSSDTEILRLWGVPDYTVRENGSYVNIHSGLKNKFILRVSGGALNVFYQGGKVDALAVALTNSNPLNRIDIDAKDRNILRALVVFDKALADAECVELTS